MSPRVCAPAPRGEPAQVVFWNHRSRRGRNNMPWVHPGSISGARAGWFVCCCAILTLSGCKGTNDAALGPMAPVKGKVSFNGAPVADGRVTFVPMEENGNALWPEGTIDA